MGNGCRRGNKCLWCDDVMCVITASNVGRHARDCFVEFVLRNGQFYLFLGFLGVQDSRN